MKTSLTIFPCVLGSAFPYIRVCPGLSFATKRVRPPCCTLFTFVTCCSLQIILSQNYLLPLISVLAENTLLKTAYHFLLLLVGFDTLTYRKDYDISLILVGHQLQRRESTYLVVKLAFHAKESPIRTRVQSSVFVSSQPTSPAMANGPD